MLARRGARASFMCRNPHSGIRFLVGRAPASRLYARIGEAVTKPMSAVLHVCVTCKAGTESEERPGLLLYAALEALLTGGSGPAELRPVSCLAACEHGCTAAIFMPGKHFGYLLGRLTPEHAEDILDYARSYGASATGAVMPSRRAPSLANAILSRFPAYGLEPANPQPKEIL
jgi:predicted metal-binding protein